MPCCRWSVQSESVLKLESEEAEIQYPIQSYIRDRRLSIEINLPHGCHGLCNGVRDANELWMILVVSIDTSLYSISVREQYTV